MKKPFFEPNIDKKGRIIRGILALGLLAGGVIAVKYMVWLSLVLFLSAGFVAYEAMRSWCFLRACGIRTKF